MPDFKLIVNADDLGHSPGINRAIKLGVLAGGITSATLLLTTPFKEDAIRDVITPLGLPVGLHLSLTEGRSIANPDSVPLLLNDNGMFHFSSARLFKTLFFPKPRHTPLLRQIRIELEAQMALICDLGLKPTHFDSHQHVHMIPAIFDILRELGPRYGYTKCRFTYEPLMRSLPWDRLCDAYANRNMLKWLAVMAGSVRIRNTFRSPNAFRGLLASSCCTLQGLLAFSARAQRGEVVEIGVHVGGGEDLTIAQGYGNRICRFLMSTERERELGIVTSRAFREGVKAHGGTFVSFADY
jgi:hypothetical protein